MPFPFRSALWGAIGLAAIMCMPAGCLSLPAHGSPPEVVADDTRGVVTAQPHVTLYVGEG